MLHSCSPPVLFLSHAQPRAQKLIDELTQRGLVAHSLNLQKIVVSAACRADIEESKQSLDRFDAIVFVSPNAVEVFFEGAQFDLSFSAKPELRWLAVGQATGISLKNALPCTWHASIQVGQSNDADGVQLLLDELRTKRDRAMAVLVVRGNTGREDWIRYCINQGDKVEVLSAYASVEQVPDPSIVDQLLRYKSLGDHSPPIVWVIASTQLATQFYSWLEQLSPEVLLWAKQQQTMAIHPKIVDRLESFGFVAPKLIASGVQGIVQGLK